MIELMMIGAAYATGAALVGCVLYWLVVWLTWPFRLKEELRNEKKWHKDTREWLRKEQEKR